MLPILQSTTNPPEVTLSNLNTVIEKLIDFGVNAGKQILIAIIIYMVGRMLIKLINRLVARLLNKERIDVGVQTFLRSLVKILLNILLFITVVGALGINTTSFAALLASAGVAIGMALSGNLSNFAGGIIILFFKPYKVGDWVEAQGIQGTVKEVQIFHTLITTIDNKVVYVPNGSMSSCVVVNYTRNATRRVDWTIGIDYGESVEHARSVVIKLLSADKRILADPAPFVGVLSLADSSVNLTIRVWVKTEDYWNVFHDVYQQIYETFNREGINFPYPQQTVHIAKD